MNRTLSIIIPALDEEEHIETAIDSVSSLDAEIIVADGGSGDDTRRLAHRKGAQVVRSGRGRGRQLRAGVSAASGSTLLFMHADSSLSPAASCAIATAMDDPAFSVGTFRLRFDRPHPLYRLYGWLTRFDSIWTSFGDQGILIRRTFYQQIGGFPAWDLLEDVALLQRARRRSTVLSLPAEMITSARRFERTGIIRQQARNASIIFRYLLGASPASLAGVYHQDPRKPHATPGQLISSPSISTR